MVRNKHRSHKWHWIARKNYHISKVVEQIFKGGLNCLQGCFRKQTGRGAFKLVVVAPLTNKLAHFFATLFLARSILIGIKLAADLTPYFCTVIMTICFVIDAGKSQLFNRSFRRHYFLSIIHAYSTYEHFVYRKKFVPRFFGKKYLSFIKHSFILLLAKFLSF